MKYVMVNDSPVLVDDQPTGESVLRNAIHQGVLRDLSTDGYAYTSAWQLQGHNANGSASVIGPEDTPWQWDFTAIEVVDNA